MTLVRVAMAAVVSFIVAVVVGVATMVPLVAWVKGGLRTECFVALTNAGRLPWSCPDELAYIVPVVLSVAVISLVVMLAIVRFWKGLGSADERIVAGIVMSRCTAAIVMSCGVSIVLPGVARMTNAAPAELAVVGGVLVAGAALLLVSCRRRTRVAALADLVVVVLLVTLMVWGVARSVGIVFLGSPIVLLLIGALCTSAALRWPNRRVPTVDRRADAGGMD